MKHECNVARDLMPLTIDGAASGESQKLLDEHLEECAACREYYNGMKAALPIALKANSEQEQKAFDDAARKLRKKRRFRLWQRLLIGFLVGLVVMGGVLWGWRRLAGDLNVPMYHGNYNVFLSQLQDGSVSFNMDFYGTNRVMGVRIKEMQENGQKIFYVYNETSRIPQYMRTLNRNYSFLRMDAEHFAQLDEIRQGVPDEYAIVWQAGDSISPASVEMETYFALWDQYTATWPAFDENGRMHTLTFEESQNKEALGEQAEAALKAVPEWQ